MFAPFEDVITPSLNNLSFSEILCIHIIVIHEILNKFTDQIYQLLKHFGFLNDNPCSKSDLYLTGASTLLKIIVMSYKFP